MALGPRWPCLSLLSLAAPPIFPHDLAVFADPPELTAFREKDGSVTLRLEGELVVAHAAVVDAALKDFAEPIARIDCAGLTRIDTVGAWLVRRTAAQHGARVVNAGEEASRLLAALHEGAARATSDEESHLVSFVPALVGRALADGWRGVLLLLGFFGEMLVGPAAHEAMSAFMQKRLPDFSKFLDVAHRSGNYTIYRLPVEATVRNP